MFQLLDKFSPYTCVSQSLGGMVGSVLLRGAVNGTGPDARCLVRAAPPGRSPPPFPWYVCSGGLWSGVTPSSQVAPPPRVGIVNLVSLSGATDTPGQGLCRPCVSRPLLCVGCPDSLAEISTPPSTPTGNAQCWSVQVQCRTIHSKTQGHKEVAAQGIGAPR